MGWFNLESLPLIYQLSTCLSHMWIHILFVIVIHMSKLKTGLVRESLTFPLLCVYDDPWEPRRDARAVTLPPTGYRGCLHHWPDSSVVPHFPKPTARCLVLTCEPASGSRTGGISVWVTGAFLSWIATSFVPFLCGHFHVTFKASWKNLYGIWEPIMEADPRKNHCGLFSFSLDTFVSFGSQVLIMIMGVHKTETPRRIWVRQRVRCWGILREDRESSVFCNREGSGSDHVTWTPGSLQPPRNTPRRTSGCVSTLSHTPGSHCASFYMGQKGCLITGDMTLMLPGSLHRLWFAVAV